MGEVVAPFKGETHLGRQHHRLAFAVEGVLWYTVHHFKFQFQFSVGTFQGDGSAAKHIGKTGQG